MAIVLLIKSEDGQVTELPIISKITVGRSSSSDFKIADSKISGQHCTFSITKKGELLFEDLSSSNGSYLNNSRIHHSLIKLNDVLRIGNTLIKIDEKKLTGRERISVGVSTIKEKEEKTLPSLGVKDPTSKKPTVILNKDLIKKKKEGKENWMGGSNEKVIEQEESSGFTKMLKLEKDGEKKKKA